ncbi:MAG: hypothetical protein KGY66_07420 [Candidatus Thermoplasmatota archaeon]|nr:hypothetical protein [Candidatus Thermoplasmatota archaeon]MBS3790728.1 hypothetical protein [Candidatus Thermoplasmatota archaeon]
MTESEREANVERLALKPEWIEDSRGENRDFVRSLILFFLGGFIILLIVGGDIGQLLSVTMIVWLGLFVIFMAGKKVSTISHWKRVMNNRKTQNLPLKRSSDITERAINGLKLSQMLIEKRLRRNIIEKVKEQKDLSKKEIEELIRENPSKLSEMVGDKELSNFIMNTKTIKDVVQEDTNSIPMKLSSLFRNQRYFDQKDGTRTAFENRIRKIIKKIDDWESR